MIYQLQTLWITLSIFLIIQSSSFSTVVYPRKNTNSSFNSQSSNLAKDLSENRGRNEENSNWITDCEELSGFELQFEDIKMNTSKGFDSNKIVSSYQQYQNVTLGFVR